MEFAGAGSDKLALLQGCTDGEILEYTDASGWACAADDTGASTNYWQLNSGALSPFSLTAEVNLGNIATDSAKISLAGSLTRGKAAAIINQTESQDILAASAAGTARLTLSNAGNLQTGDLTLGLNDTSALITTADTEDLTIDPASTGNIILTAGTTLDINAASVDLSTQATDIELINTQATALTISESTNNYLVIDTSGEIVTFGGATNPSFAFSGTGAVTITGAEGSNKLTLTAGDAVVSDGSLSITDDDDAASTLSVTNNAATTTGVGAAGGVNVLSSTTLSTGDLLELQLTESALTTGNYLTAWDVTAGASVFEIGEDGILTVGTGAIQLTDATGNIIAGAYGAASIDGDDINGNLAGSGLVLTAASPDTLDIDLDSSAADGATTSSTSGLEFDGGQLTLIRGCAEGGILEWDNTNFDWQCGTDNDTGGSPRLDQIIAATTGAGAIDSNANTVEWNWDFTTAAVDSGLIISESTASINGTQDQQALLELITLSGSTASPLQVTAAGTDFGDIWFDLTNAADFEIRAGGTAFVTFDQAGLTTFSDDVDMTFGTGENLLISNASVAPTEDMVSITTDTGTASPNIDGLSVNWIQGESSGTNAAIRASITGSGTAGETAIGLQVVTSGIADGTLNGISISTITGGGGSEVALNIGNGWDTGISLGTGLTTGISVGSGGITVTAGGLTITAGALAVNSDSITSDDALTIDANDSVVLGGGGNTFTFDESSGPVYAGTARPIKRITLASEYAGAALTGDGSSNNGTMTSDNNLTASSYKNFYNWTATSGSAQDYDIWVRVPLPSDWAAWTSTAALTIEGWSDTLANTTETVTVYDTAGTADCTAVNFEPGSPSTYADTAPASCTDTGTNTYAADGIMTIKISLSSLSSANARVGRIYLEYRAKF